MANAKVARVGEESVQDILLEVAGLEQTGPGEFVLRNVAVTRQVDWQRIEEQLVESGIERRHVMFLVEDFARQVTEFQLAMAIAQRTKRIG